jgi:hypothetical protein
MDSRAHRGCLDYKELKEILDSKEVREKDLISGFMNQ